MKCWPLLLVLLASPSFCQDSTSHSRSSADSLSTIVSVFYFGGSDCTFCVMPKEIASINVLRRELPKMHPEERFKFVLVVMDTDIRKGIGYARKYPKWDEVSIGSFYNNELMLEHVNGTKLPGVPHLLVYRDTLAKRPDFAVPRLCARTLLGECVGGSKIQLWIKDGYPLQYK